MTKTRDMHAARELVRQMFDKAGQVKPEYYIYADKNSAGFDEFKIQELEERKANQ